MKWEENEHQFRSEIKSMIEANEAFIPDARLADIRHYFEHGELSMAFEYLMMEIIDHNNNETKLDHERAAELALIFQLNDVNNCMIDGEFWQKFQNYLKRQAS